MKKFIAVAGNVGVGKSTLTRMLSAHLCWEPFFEAVDDNPYLADFYQDMRTWSFHSQIFFLSRRLGHHRQILERPGTVIQDRTVYEDAEIFARNLYLQAPVPALQERIRQRGRDYEQQISVEYLTQLNDLYDQWAASFSLSPVLTVRTEKLNFVAVNSHLELIAARVLDKLHGKEVMVLE
jgi:deoxyadenosine/deoxycytidine kinase